MLTDCVQIAETEESKKVWDEMIRLIKNGHLSSSAKIQAQMNLNIWRQPDRALKRGGKYELRILW